MSDNCGVVLPVEVGDILIIDTSKSLRPGIPTESQLKVVTILGGDMEFKKLVVENLTTENRLPSAFEATIFRGRRSPDGPWLDGLGMDHGIFPYEFEITKVEKAAKVEGNQR